MYIRKDIYKSLRLEAKMAENSHCYAWAKLFSECEYLLRKKDLQNAKLREALQRIAESADPDVPWYWFRNTARAALGVENG
jgi:hypothetical protein